jgi:hypothetical protein
MSNVIVLEQTFQGWNTEQLESQFSIKLENKNKSCEKKWGEKSPP